MCLSLCFVQWLQIVVVTVTLDVATLPSMDSKVAKIDVVNETDVQHGSERIQDRFLPAALPIEMKQLLWCAELCDHGPTLEDEIDAKNTAASWSQRKKDEDEQTRFMASCMWRCRINKKTEKERLVMPTIDSYRELPARLQEYHRVVGKCVAAGTRPLSEIVSALKLCGVAHLDLGLFDVELVQQLLFSYNALRQNSSHPLDRIDRSRLRAGREEFWPPFAWPFNASALLRPTWLPSVIRQYLGTNAIFDHMTVLVAPAATATEAQDVHQDTQELRRYVEIHIPLVDITKAMGPTLFCPGSQGMMQCSDAIKYYFFFLNCSEDSSLSYALPLHAGQVTVYDGTVFHGGTANIAGVDRPVLQLSWAADEESVEERNYAKKAFRGDQFRRERQAIEIDAFRTAAIAVDGDLAIEDRLDSDGVEL